jgi:hypothetical protein
MKMARIGTLLLTCALAVPSFGQQKTYGWVQGNDETVRLDPGYYHTSPPYKPGSGSRSMHVDIDAQRPVTLAVVSLQSWNDAGQRPESMAGLSLLCFQAHVIQTTYTCDVPLGIPMVLLVRDERSDRGAYAGRGEITRGRDYDRQQASQPATAERPQSPDADRDRHDAGRALAAAVDAWTGSRARREFASPNEVHIEYYDWACTDNCNLPDPPRPKLFDWVPKSSQADRLDPGEFFEGETWDFPQKEVTYHLDVEARKPVTIAVVEAQEWNDAVAQNAGKTPSNINYICIQQHVTRITFTCTIPVVWRPTFMVVRDERDPLPSDQYTRAASGGGQNTAAKVGQPTAPPGVQVSAARIFQRANPAFTQNPAPSTNPTVTASDWLRPFLAANDIRLTPYFWQCVDACDQPDYAWAFQVNESYPLSSAAKVYGGAVIPDHDGEQINIHVKSPVPMAVAMLRPKTAFRVINQSDQLETALEKSPCVQRGVQESTFQCTFNLADGPQSLVLWPESGVDIPARKKAEVALQAYKCVDNCAGPSFAWVGAVHEKYHPTNILKMYGGFTADHDGEQVSIKIKSPVPVTAAMLPTRQASQLYGKPQLFDEQVQSSSCEQRNVQDSVFQCTIDIADGSQSLVVRPEPGYTLPKDKKAEVDIQTMKCVAKCEGIAPSR